MLNGHALLKTEHQLAMGVLAQPAMLAGHLHTCNAVQDAAGLQPAQTCSQNDVCRAVTR